MFLISWFFYLFLLCSIRLLVKYAFILRYEAWVNLSECLVSLKTFLKSAQNQSVSNEICSGSSHEIGCSLPIVFQRNWPWKFPRNSREIGRFFREFAPENPAKFDFFPATYQKPCEMTSQSFPVSCFWSRSFVTHRKWNLTHQNTGKENYYRIIFLLYLSVHWGEFITQIKKICHIHFKTLSPYFIPFIKPLKKSGHVLGIGKVKLFIATP